MPAPPRSPASIEDLLSAAVDAIDGSPRTGQQEMAQAVAKAFDTGEHLLVQAGTGTGKSLAYLVPALAHGEPVVVATATIALQRQLIERDLPRLVDALEPLLGRRVQFAIAKGRSNYICVHRLRADESGGGGDDVLFDDDALLPPTSKAGRDAVRIREWAQVTTTGDKDELTPAPDDRAWRSLSVTAHECLGQKCPFVSECFAERARDRARHVDVVVTNHSMLTIDALTDPTLLPEHDVVIIDEAHELADRATSAITDELTATMVSRASRRARPFAGAETAAAIEDAADALERALATHDEGRIDELEGALFDALVAVRDSGRAALTAITREQDAQDDIGRRMRAQAAVDDAYDIAGRVLAAGDNDVTWVTKPDRRAPVLHRAPLFVGGLLREKLFATKTVVLTSATLTVGGEFTALARTVGLVVPEAADTPPPAWRGLDVGSPFDYARQAIVYVAAHLDPPARDGITDAMIDELAELIQAAGGRTLGLFSSMRAAVRAADVLRDRLPFPVLCQGEDSTAELVRQFASDAATCLFGTMSLWQGVDVPGSACQLVVIDRLPFPRPDDPLSTARQRAVSAAGGNGFMSVAVPAAALKLAQGAGRLIRTSDDVGVVAVLDSRLATARYAPALRASLPPMWSTTDPAVVRRSLASIAASAKPVLPVSRAHFVDESEGLNGDVANEPQPAAKELRPGRRWTDDEERDLVSQFHEGTPPTVLAEAFARSRGAVIARLRKLHATGHVLSAPGERDRHDNALAHELACLPAVTLSTPDALAEALDLDGWRVEQNGDGQLIVRRGEVVARIGWHDTEALIPAHDTRQAVTSWWVIAPVIAPMSLDDAPSGVDGVVVPPPWPRAEGQAAAGNVNG